MAGSYADRQVAAALRQLDLDLAEHERAVAAGRRCFGGDWSEELERHGATPMSLELDRLLAVQRRSQ